MPPSVAVSVALLSSDAGSENERNFLDACLAKSPTPTARTLLLLGRKTLSNLNKAVEGKIQEL